LLKYTAPKDSSMPSKLLIFIPGGGVPNVNYTQTMMAIQKETAEVF
jgi:hypothetical protein